MSPANPALRARIDQDIADETRRAKNGQISQKWRDLLKRETTDCDGNTGCRVNKFLAAFGPGYHEHFTQPDEAAALGRDDRDFQFGETVEISPADRAFAFSKAGGAEAKFLALSKAKTGATLDDAKLATGNAARAKLLAQSHAIADKMGEAYAAEAAELAQAAAAAGADPSATQTAQSAMRADACGLWRYYVHSQHYEKIPAFRRIMFLPVVAQQIRAPMLAALEFWLSRNAFARFWTFTTGTKTRLCDVRVRCQELHRRLSKLNAQPFMRAAGASLVFRSTELGTPELLNTARAKDAGAGNIDRDDAGTVLFHVHAHTVVHLNAQLEKPAFRALLASVKKFWVHNWDDGGSIRSAREACKYVTKPGAMLKLSGAELVELQTQLSRLKMVQPLGRLKDEITARTAAKLRLVRQETKDGAVLGEVANWNLHGRMTREEKAQQAAGKLGAKTESAISSRIVARCLPGFGPAGVAENSVVVMATAWNGAEVRALPAVVRLVAATAEAYAAGVAIRVHTCTPTVRAAQPAPRPAKPRGRPRIAALWVSREGVLT